MPCVGRPLACRGVPLTDRPGVEVELVQGRIAEKVGWLSAYSDELLEALHVVECLLRSPASLALFLQAASFEPLELAGASPQVVSSSWTAPSMIRMMGEQLCLFERQEPADSDEGDSRMLSGNLPLPRVQFTARQDPDEHPAERLRRRGPRSLTDSEVLSLILGGDELESIRDLLGEIGLVGLAQLDQDFFYQSGWDEQRTASLIAAVELARRLAHIRIPEGQLMDRPDYVAN